MTEKREKKLKSLIRFHSAKKIENCTSGFFWGEGRGKNKNKEKIFKNPNESTEQVKTQE